MFCQMIDGFLIGNNRTIFEHFGSGHMVKMPMAEEHGEFGHADTR